MSRRQLTALLAVGALAAIVINALYFAGAESPPSAGDEDWESESDPRPVALRQLEWDEVTAHLASLPEPEADRSPFFTREESLRLASVPDAATSDAREKALRLDGTLYGRLRRVAWLDGRPRSEGDPVAGFRVVGIVPGAVTLVRGEETLRLEVGRGGVNADVKNGEQNDAE